MNYLAYHSIDVINGPGTRCTLFVSGCEHRCKGCYNAKTWSPKAGHLFDGAIQEKIMADLADPRIPRDGLSLSGGDPFYPANHSDILTLVQTVKTRFPKKTIWCWTGYELEHLSQQQRLLLPWIDVLVDGPFIENLKSPQLPWQGSRNQRIHQLSPSVIPIQAYE